MRGKYIYLIYKGEDVVSAHTIKYEAHDWVRESRWDYAQVRLVRVKDGRAEKLGRLGKEFTAIEWDEKLIKLPDEHDKFRASMARASSQVEDWPDWARRNTINVTESE